MAATSLRDSNRCGPLTESRLKKFETALKAKLPDDYRAFLLAKNGGRPARKMDFEWLFALHDGPHDPDDYDDRFAQSLQDVWKDFRREMPKAKVLPIARDPGGNLFCLGYAGDWAGRVYFYDHEVESLEPLASSFTAFLAGQRDGFASGDAKPVAAGFFTESFDSDVPVRVLSTGYGRGHSTHSPTTCPGCGKFEAVDCLEAGSAASVDARRVKAEYGTSQDNQLVVSGRVLAVFRSVPGVELKAYPIGTDVKPTHWVVLPTCVLPPKEPIPPAKSKAAADTAFRSHGPKCKACGKYGDVTFGLEWVSIPPDTVFAAIPLVRKESAGNVVRVFNGELASALKQAGIPKFRVAAIENRWNG